LRECSILAAEDGRWVAKRMWERQVVRRRRIRLPVAEFCRQEGVSLKLFYAWRKRFQETAARPLFVPVEVPDSAAPRRGHPAVGKHL